MKLRGIQYRINAGNLGKDMQRGILAGFERANRNGRCEQSQAAAHYAR